MQEAHPGYLTTVSAAKLSDTYTRGMAAAKDRGDLESGEWAKARIAEIADLERFGSHSITALCDAGNPNALYPFDRALRRAHSDLLMGQIERPNRNPLRDSERLSVVEAYAVLTERINALSDSRPSSLASEPEDFAFDQCHLASIETHFILQAFESVRALANAGVNEIEIARPLAEGAALSSTWDVLGGIQFAEREMEREFSEREAARERGVNEMMAL